ARSPRPPRASKSRLQTDEARDPGAAPGGGRRLIEHDHGPAQDGAREGVRAQSEDAREAERAARAGVGPACEDVLGARREAAARRAVAIGADEAAARARGGLDGPARA